MKAGWRALFGALVAVTALGCVHAQHVPLQPEELYERLAPSVWLVEVRRTDGEGGLGSAVVIAPETLITNCHVVEKASAITVAHDGRRLPARVQYRDVQRDLCQLQAPGLAARSVRLAGVASLRVGATLYALGNPRGLELTLSHGLLSALRRNQAGAVQYLQVSVPISRGSSGGGLFDVYGRLVGITTFLINDSQNLNFAMPADFVVELPERNGGAAVARLDPPNLPLPRPLQSPSLPPVATVAPPAAVPEVPALPPARTAALPPSPTPSPAPSPAPAQPSAPQASIAPIAPVAPQASIAPPAPLPSSPAAIEAGAVLEYALRDRITGRTRTVTYRLERIEGDELVFNDGSRVEKVGGQVLRMATPIAGEFEQAMPAGGWTANLQGTRRAWPGNYDAAGDGRTFFMELTQSARTEGVFRLQGRELRTIGLQFQGYTTRGGGIGNNPPGRYAATAWYAPELDRIVRFEARSRGGLGHTAFVVDEVLELVAIRTRE